jgi:tetratricopeptide (TPR) repeat protein
LAGKAWALARLDEYDMGQQSIERVLELDPGDAWSQGLYGSLLCDIADYERAIQELREATKLDSTMGWIFNNLGEAYARLAQEEQDVAKAKMIVQQAVDAYTRSVDLDKEDLTSQTWLGDAVLSLGEAEKDRALNIFQTVIDACHDRTNLDFRTTEAVGWCYYRLATQGEDDTESLLTEAERLLVDSLALRKDKPSGYSVIMTRFRLALVILHSGRYQLAFKEYENSSSLTKQKQLVIQRGIFDRARKDLQEAIRKDTVGASVAHAEKILNMLEKEYSNVRKARQATNVAE